MERKQISIANKKKNRLMTISLIVVLLIVIGILWKKDELNQDKSNSVVIETEFAKNNRTEIENKDDYDNFESIESNRDEVEKVVVIDNLEEVSLGEIWWLNEPEEIEIDFIDKDKNMDKNGRQIIDLESSKTYKVANISDGGELIYFQMELGIPVKVGVRIIRREEEIFVVLNEELTISWVREDLAKVINEGVKFINLKNTDKILTYENLNFKGVPLELGSDFLFDSDEDLEYLGEVAQGELYSRYVSIMDDKEIMVREIYFLFDDGFYYEYNFNNEMMDETEVLDITWADGGENDMLFGNKSSGCMTSGEIMVIRDGSNLLEGKVKIGELGNGEDVYQIRDVDNGLLLKLYESYKMGRDDGEEGMFDIEDFVNKISHFLWQDAYGDWQIWVNKEFKIMADC